VKCGSASDSRERRRRRRRQRQQQEEEEEEARRRDETKGTRDPTDFVTKSGHEKKAEQTPFLLPTWDKTHTHLGQNTRTKHGSKLGTTIQPESDIDFYYRLQGFFLFFSFFCFKLIFNKSFLFLFRFCLFIEILANWEKKNYIFFGKNHFISPTLGTKQKWILINGLVKFIDGFLGIKKL
jgi:hypothetical protein